MKMLAAAAFAAILIAAGVAAWNRVNSKPAPLPAASRAAAKALPSAQPCAEAKPCGHFLDYSKALATGDRSRFDAYMASILRESDIDIRFVFVAGTGEQSIEAMAVELVDRLRIGGRTGDRRGVLLLFDTTARRLKVEVGYGLEGYFPDAFASYLVRDHARHFFESGNISVGLRWTLRLLHHRIREATLGMDFDPRLVEKMTGLDLSGGAGVTAALPATAQSASAPQAQPNALARFIPRATPEEAYSSYLEWLAWPRYEPQVPHFTDDTRRYLAGLPISPAYREYILLSELGKQSRIVERGDLAILYYTNTPFPSPHFFVREGGLWRIDIMAEVRNTIEYVGGAHTWGYRGTNDAYTLAFADLLEPIGSIRRFRDGDNRPLPTRRPS